MVRRLAAVAAVLLVSFCVLRGAFTAHAAPATIDDFFAAAALQPGDFPSGLVLADQGPISLDQLAADAGSNATDELSALGFQGAYAQGYRVASALAALTGQPAGVGDLIAVFDTPDDASAWFSFESQVPDMLGSQLAAGQGAAFTVLSITPLDLGLPGDQSVAFDVEGSASISGIAIPIHVAIGIMQRGQAVSTVVVAATQDQSAVMASLSQTLDANVVAALPLLAS